MNLTIFLFILSLCSFSSSYIVSGTAFNSFDHTSYQGATVTMMSTDGTVYSGTSGSGGLFSVSVPSGVYNFNITAPGKWYTNIDPLPVSADISDYDFALVDVQTGMDFEFLIFWGSTPSNLDAYLFTNDCNASVYSTSCTTNGATAEWAYDDRNGWGPESTVLKNASPGRYEFWVHLVSSSGSDNFLMGQSTKLPTAYASFPVVDPSTDAPVYTQITTGSDSSDPSYTWWRAAVLEVSSTRDVSRSNFDISFPNEVYTAPPTLPFTTPVPSSPSSPTPSAPTPTTPAPATPTSPSTPSTPTPSIPGGFQIPNSAPSKPSVGDRCQQEQVTYCQYSMGSCLSSSNSDSNATCSCYMNLGACLQGYGCTDYTNFQEKCSSYGCDGCSEFTSGSSKILHSWVTIVLIAAATFFVMPTMI